MMTIQTSEAELKQFFAAYGLVKDCKIILDRAGVSKGYCNFANYFMISVLS